MKFNIEKFNVEKLSEVFKETVKCERCKILLRRNGKKEDPKITCEYHRQQIKLARIEIK